MRCGVWGIMVRVFFLGVSETDFIHNLKTNIKQQDKGPEAYRGLVNQSSSSYRNTASLFTVTSEPCTSPNVFLEE